MKIKDGCEVRANSILYYLTEGMIKPQDILENDDDIEEVQGAIDTLNRFYNSCESQIEDFYR